MNQNTVGKNEILMYNAKTKRFAEHHQQLHLIGRGIHLKKKPKYVVNQERLAAYMSEKKVNEICLLCGNGKMELITEIVHGLYEFPFTLSDKGEYKVAALYPYTCKNCGNTHFINAYQQGLIELPEEMGNET